MPAQYWEPLTVSLGLSGIGNTRLGTLEQVYLPLYVGLTMAASPSQVSALQGRSKSVEKKTSRSGTVPFLPHMGVPVHRCSLYDACIAECAG